MAGYPGLKLQRKGSSHETPAQREPAPIQPSLGGKHICRGSRSVPQDLPQSRKAVSNTKRILGETAGCTSIRSKLHFERILGFWTLPSQDTAGSGRSQLTTFIHSEGWPTIGTMAAAVAGRNGRLGPGSAVGGPVSGMIHRPSLVEDVRTASASSLSSAGSISGSVGEEKPIASGNGVSLSISLAEPVLFLQGFDQSELANQTTTMLRGSFHLRVSKSAKIKTISLAFRGRAETEWPEGQ